jgi:tRNA pseudouridine55 synthase
LHGILLLDKPTGLTSNQALQRVKKLFNARKAGHTGSLDPLATGMLPICFGEATKLTAFLLDARKVYRVAARLGVSTDTGDADGTPTAEVERSSLDPAQIDAALAATIGPMEQTPPMYSALKRGGKPLYVLARQGIVVPRQPRTVQIFDARRLGFDWPILEFSVLCSKGTYIRTFVEDLARALGTLGHVAGLRRLAVEPFEESGMIPLDSLSERGAAGLEALDAALLPVDSALPHWPRLVVSEAACRRLTQGQAMAAEPSWPEGRVRLYSPEGCLVGIGEVSPRRELVPRRIFPGLGPWC